MSRISSCARSRGAWASAGACWRPWRASRWSESCQRLDLAVLEWNPARKLYEHLGFTNQSQWVPYRLPGEDIARLAAESQYS